MARCYICGELLDDDWLKSQGAALMGRAKGQRKARSKEVASAAAQKRWKKKRAKILK